MIYNPITKKLFTNDMTFIKQLSCPYNIHWDLLAVSEHERKRFCSLCQDYVHDTEGLSDKEVLQMVDKKHDICLKLSIEQKNIKIRNV